MPYEGMFSLVVADYGQAACCRPPGAGLHQFQTGRWVQSPTSDTLIVVPAVVTIGATR